MPHSRSARKRARQAEARRVRNRSQRSALRTQLKKVLAAIESGDQGGARTELNRAIRTLDRAARKGLIHSRQAARRKSRLEAKFSKSGGAAPSAAPSAPQDSPSSFES